MRIILAGYGKMGKLIGKIAESRGHVISGIIERDTPSSHYRKIMKQGEVLIDFTGPNSAFPIIIQGIENGIAVVSGSTGWLNEYEKVTSMVNLKKGSFLYASNFSLGVNLFFSLNEYLVTLMQRHPEYHPSIKEIHHTEKLDAPSGTAITLSKAFKKSPDIESLREKDVPGTHIIDFNSTEDLIQIKHVAKNRNGFAIGAVTAAEWLLGKQGVFSMKDVLHF
jgi:4-hydroxy-tetrahydrodipicolinate reductase